MSLQNDLDRSPILDDHLMDVIMKIVEHNNFKRVSVISAMEEHFLKLSNDIIRLNEELPKGLRTTLNLYKSHVSVDVIMDFLLYCLDNPQDNGKDLGSALSVLDLCVENDLTITRDNLKKLIQEDLPMTWNIYIIDNPDVFRKKTPTLQSGLDLDRLRNFK